MLNQNIDSKWDYRPPDTGTEDPTEFAKLTVTDRTRFGSAVVVKGTLKRKRLPLLSPALLLNHVLKTFVTLTVKLVAVSGLAFVASANWNEALWTFRVVEYPCTTTLKPPETFTIWTEFAVITGGVVLT